MTKVESYRVVHAKNFTELEEKVNYAIREGWIPQGGVNHVAMSRAQAMILPAFDLEDPGPM